MTKDEYVSYIEKSYRDHKESKLQDLDTEDEIKVDVFNNLYNSMEEYISLLKNSEYDYCEAHVCTTVYYDLLTTRLEKISEDLLSVSRAALNEDDDFLKSVENTLLESFLLSLNCNILSIFICNGYIEEVGEETASNLKRVIEDYKKRKELYSEGVLDESLVNQSWDELFDYIDDKGYTKNDVRLLENLIGEQPEFDEAMGRGIGNFNTKSLDI